MYKLIINIAKEQLLVRTENNAFIPFDPANTDYQAYLKWVSEGNTAQPADNNG